MLLLLLACAGPKASDSGDTAAEPFCTSDLAPGEKAVFADGLTDGSEGLTFSGDRLHVSVPDGVLVHDGAAFTRLATTGNALGLAPAADGGVLLADPGVFTFDGSGDDGRVLHVATDGTLTELAAGMPNPNFLLDNGDVLLVSDDTAAIYAVSGGAFTPWTDAVPSPNGMAWSPARDRLYVATTFENPPLLWEVPVTDGVAGTPVVVTQFDTGSAPDGVAVDAEGGVWVALNLAGEVVRVDPATGLTTDRFTGLTTPASLAFGTGSFDPCSLYVTELFGDIVWRLSTGYAGDPVTAWAGAR